MSLKRRFKGAFPTDDEPGPAGFIGRLEELVARHNTLAQAKFYVEHLGADFSDYVAENEAYSRSLRVAAQALEG